MAKLIYSRNLSSMPVDGVIYHRIQFQVIDSKMQGLRYISIAIDKDAPIEKYIEMLQDLTIWFKNK